MFKSLCCITALVIALTMTMTVHAADAGSDTKTVNLDKDPHLQGWWKFDETKGTTAADSSTHKRKGTLKEGLSFDKHSVPGKFGKAIMIDKDNDRAVEINGYKGVTGTQARTVAAWIKKTIQEVKSSNGEKMTAE